MRMDDDLGKLTMLSHAHAESTVKLLFGGNDSDQLLSDDLFKFLSIILRFGSAGQGSKDSSNCLCAKHFLVKV